MDHSNNILDDILNIFLFFDTQSFNDTKTKVSSNFFSKSIELQRNDKFDYKAIKNLEEAT